MRGRGMPSLDVCIRRHVVISVVALSLCSLCHGQSVPPAPAEGDANEEVIFRSSEDEGIETFAVSPDGKLLAMLCYDVSGPKPPKEVIRVWDISTRRIRFSKNLRDDLLALCGDMVAGMKRTTIYRWQTAFSPDGKYLAAGALGWDTILCWEVATGKECLRVPLDDTMRQFYRQIWFSRDGRTLTLELTREWWIGGPDAWIEEFVAVDTASWRVTSRRRIPSGEIYAAAVQTDGKSVVGASQDGETITRWISASYWERGADPPKVAETYRLNPPVPEEHRDVSSWLTFSPDPSTVAVSGRLIRWFDGKPNTILLEKGDSAHSDSLAFSPDGRRICAIRAYNVETLAAKLPVATLRWVGQFVELPLYRFVGEAHVWDATTGRLLWSRKRNDWNPSTVAFFAGNDRIAISDDNEVLVCRLPAK
jgi:WD40 repeat protein